MRPPVWQLVRDAMEHFNREVSYSEIKKHVLASYPDVNTSTLTCQLVICSVNHPSRIHYPENRKPRVSTGQYDFLYHTARGRVAPYDSEKHGIWEIAVVEGSTTLCVRILGEPTDEPATASEAADDLQGTFAVESHLRDYLGRNLSLLGNFGEQLGVYISPDGREGIEFQTDVGPIDILAVSSNGDFYVFELKLGRGPDVALGQILRYMGWVSAHLAGGKKVRGVVLASDISKKLRYAATQVPSITLMEYELRFALKSVSLASEV